MFYCSFSFSLSLSLSLSVQLSGWWFLTFTASELKDKVQYLNGVQYLYDKINPDQLEIPQFVFDFDRQVSVYKHTLVTQAEKWTTLDPISQY